MAIILGIFLGILSLAPNLYLVPLTTLLMPNFTSDSYAFIAVTIGFSLGLQNLQAYLPNPDPSYADSHTQLAYKGQAHLACALLRLSHWFGATVAIFVALLIFPIAHTLAIPFKAVTVLLLISTLVITTIKSSRPFLTAFALLLSSTLGITTFSYIDSQHSITALLTGLISAPLLIASYTSLKPLPKQRHSHIHFNVPLHLFGSILGVLSGFIAGLGTSTLMSTFRKPHHTLAQQIAIEATSESANITFALATFFLLSSTRSGFTAFLAPATPSLAPLLYTLLLFFLALTLSILLSSVLQPYYHSLIPRLPYNLFSTLLLLASLYLITSHTSLPGLLITLSGICLTLFNRHYHLPNQISLFAITSPVIVFLL